MSRFCQKINLTLPTMMVAILAIGPGLAHGYVGPTAGIGVFSAAAGFLVAFVSAIGVIVAWPIRIVLRKIRGPKQRRDAIENANA